VAIYFSTNFLIFFEDIPVESSVNQTIDLITNTGSHTKIDMIWMCFPCDVDVKVIYFSVSEFLAMHLPRLERAEKWGTRGS